MKTLFKISNLKILFFVFFFTNLSNVHSQGFSGSIYFRDGSRIDFNYIGSIENIKNARFKGQIGAQYFTYELKDFSEVIFNDKTKGYSKTRGLGTMNTSYGTLIIVNKQGNRYTLEDAEFEGPNSGSIEIVYNDPISNKISSKTISINGNVYRIVIGKESGKVKYNPNTGEYFSPYYNFDPYTGDKLIWADR